MFQDTRQRNDNNQPQEQQERQKSEHERKAGILTEEVRNKMQRDTELRSYESRALEISGRLRESHVTERPRTSAQEVSRETERQAMLNIDGDLSQLEVPLAQDTRWTVRDAARRAIMQRASAIEAQRAETSEARPTNKLD